MNQDPLPVDPEWLELEEVLEFHAAALEAEGGDAGRFPDKLESILQRPKTLFKWGESPTICRCAARYGVAIARGHPFVDGNKRTAVSAVTGFLYLNGYVFDPADEDEAVRMFEGIAEGSIDEEEFRAWIQVNTEPMP